MSADPRAVIAETVADMRAIANAATRGPWVIDFGCVAGAEHPGHKGEPTRDWLVEGVGYGGEFERARDEDIRHIARWHPLVALAVADMLEGIAEGMRQLNMSAATWMCTAGEIVVTPRQHPVVTAALAACEAWRASKTSSEGDGRGTDA